MLPRARTHWRDCDRPFTRYCMSKPQPVSNFGARRHSEGLMTYKTVMVGLAFGQPNDSRLEIAAQLAERFGAGVVGVAAAEFSPPLYFAEGDAAQKLIDQGWAAVKNRLVGLESEFRAAMQNRAKEVEWRSAEDFPTRYIVQQARACDIIVVGEAARGALVDPF